MSDEQDDTVLISIPEVEIAVALRAANIELNRLNRILGIPFRPELPDNAGELLVGRATCDLVH